MLFWKLQVGVTGSDDTNVDGGLSKNELVGSYRILQVAALGGQVLETNHRQQTPRLLVVHFQTEWS